MLKSCSHSLLPMLTSVPYIQLFLIRNAFWKIGNRKTSSLLASTTRGQQINRKRKEEHRFLSFSPAMFLFWPKEGTHSVLHWTVEYISAIMVRQANMGEVMESASVFPNATYYYPTPIFLHRNSCSHPMVNAYIYLLLAYWKGQLWALCTSPWAFY